MGPEVQQYPFLTVDEWSGVCVSFVTACERSIGESDEWTSIAVRKQHGVDFVRITRAASPSSEGSTDGEQRGADAISDCGGAFEEADDEVAVVPAKQPNGERTLLVTYEILLSSSYRVPVLHFTVMDTAGHAVTDLATICADLVPSDFKAPVATAGILGGVSMNDHPLTGLPSFFVHPCNTADAMRQVGAGRPVSVSEYLFLWMGIVPPAVGLSMPATLLHRVQADLPTEIAAPDADQHGDVS